MESAHVFVRRGRDVIDLFAELPQIKATTYGTAPGLLLLAPLQKMMEHLLMRTANHCHDAKKPSMPVPKCRHAGLFWPANVIYYTTRR
jgi:hypothetical protein